MRPPRCWIRYQGDVLDALVDVAYARMTHNEPAEIAASARAVVARETLRGHVANCEDCETP